MSEFLNIPTGYEPEDDSVKLIRRLEHACEKIEAFEVCSERNRMLTSILEGVTEPILVIDADYNIIFQNQSADVFIGSTSGTGFHKCYEDLHQRSLPCNSDSCPCPLEAVLNTGKPVAVTHKHATKDGLRLHDIVASPLIGPSGKVAGIIETSRDVTDREQDRQELNHARARLEFLLSNTPAVIYSCRSGSDWLVTSMSSNIRDVLGYSPEEFIGAPGFWLDRLHPDDKSRVLETCAGITADAVTRLDYRFLHKDGSYRSMHDEIRLAYDHTGGPAEYVGYWIDVTPLRKAEDERLQVERQQKAILDNIPDIAWLKDAFGIYIAANEAFAAVCGCKASDIAGKTDYDLWPKDLADKYTNDDRMVMDTGSRVSFEEPIFDVTSGRRWIHTIKTPIHGVNGDIIGTTGIARDITAKKFFEDLLADSEERYRSLFVNSLDAIFLSEPDGIYYDANPSAELMLGYSKEELIHLGRNGITDMSDPNMEKYLSDRKTHGNARAELTFIRKDGTKFPADVSAAAFNDSYGNQKASIIVRDITARKKREDELRRFKSIIERSGEEFYLFDETGRFAYANEAARKNTGYTREELSNMRLCELDPNFTEDKTQAIFADQRDHEVPPFETVHLTKDGRTVSKEVTAAHVVIGGKDHYAAFARDITARKTLERQRNDFIAMVTHDLKSPLTVILGYAELISMDCATRDETDTKEMAEIIHQSGIKLLRMVDDFLTISRMEAGRLELKVMPEDMEQILLKLKKDFMLQAVNKGLELVMEIEPGLPRLVMDGRQIDRAIGNLLQNALNYTPKGGVVTIRATEVPFEGRRGVMISVSDTGPGIPAEEREKVFSKYYRSPRTAGIKGSGLGLTIVKAVTEAHGGSIKLCSSEGGGACFEVVLPVD